MGPAQDNTNIPTPARIRAIRKALGLSQEAFALRMGCSFTTVNRWENGHRKPTRLAVFQIHKLEQEAERQGDLAQLPGGEGDALGTSRKELVAVALRGRLLLFDPARADRALDKQNQLTLPGELGPPRSIGFDHLYGRPVLLLGARDGVLLRQLQGEGPDIRFPFGQRSGRGYGTNSARISHGYLYATHSEQGLWRWPLDQPASPERLFPELLGAKQTIRCVSVLDRERMFFIADRELYAFSRNAGTPDLLHEIPQGARLTAASLHEHTIYIAAGDGRLEQFDLVFRRRQPLISHEQAHLYSARLVRCMNSPFLVLGMRKPQVLLLGLGNNDGRFAYASGSALLRLATATNRHVIATDHARNSIFIWQADQPEAPIARIPVAQTLRHHIQDICVAQIEEASAQ